MRRRATHLHCGGRHMNRVPAVVPAVLSLAVALGAQDKEPLRLVQTIPLADVSGLLDHLTIDLEGQRLFVASGNDGTTKVLDGKTLAVTGSQTLSLGADLVDYDARAKQLYVGHGGKD